MIRVALADDHTVVIEGLELVLKDNSSEIEVVVKAESGEDLLKKMKTTGVDVAVLDISFPEGMSGLETLKTIQSDFPETKVLMLTMHKDLLKIKTAIQQGASGYVFKNHSGKELVNAITTIYQGEKYYSQDVKEVFFNSEMSTQEIKKATPEKIEITEREAELLKLLANDNSTKIIADELGVSIKTIEAQKSKLKEKIGAHSEKGLVRFAADNGYT